MISEKTDKYSFLIANTDSSDKEGAHCFFGFFCYYSFGIDGLKSFIIQGNESVIQKILLGVEKMTRTDSKIRQQNNSCKYKIFDERV